MKLSGAQATAFCRSPDPSLAGALLHGPDQAGVASSRRELIASLLGPGGDPLRLDRLDSATVRRDPAALDAAIRARGFFAGRGVLLIDGATDSASGPLDTVLRGAAPDDAFVLVTSGALTAKSPLRRLFESGKTLIALEISAERLSPAEIESRLRALGMRQGLSDGAVAFLASLAAAMDPSAFERLLETVAMYAMHATGPLAVEEVSALAPSGLDSELEGFVAAVAAGNAEAIGPLLRRLTGAGVTPVGLLLGLQRHFRQLLIVASAAGGPEAGLARVRPPLWGARRDQIRAQLGAWRRDRLELAARLLFEADARIRSAERAPALALVERCALRLAMMAGR